MFYATDENSIKLHVANDGQVWYANGIDSPQNSQQSVDTFLLSSPLLRLTTNVRITGVHANSEMITCLYLRKRQKELASIAIAGPNICDTPLELLDPYTTLMRMRSTMLPAACGGWHPITDADYITHALIAKVKRSGDWFDDSAKAFYSVHPAHSALSFIGNYSEQDAAMLLTTIIDPRWYVDRRMPDRTSKLALFLGLTPKTQKRASDPTKLVRGGRDLRCVTVLRTWKTSNPADINYDLPQNFLWRIWRNAGGGPKGDLRASQAFIHYLRLNWLDTLVQRHGLRDRIFSPKDFFKLDTERVAFVQHMI